MDGMYQDIIIMLTILFFGFWVIKGHYDNVWKIEQLEIQLKKAREIGDLTKMQNDIISLKQDCINIDAKYKIKDEWLTDRLQQLIDIVQQQMSVQDALNTFDNAKNKQNELVESYEEGAGIKNV